MEVENVKEAQMGMTFGQAFDTAQAGLKAWREKPHNERWWKWMEGTPVPNDLSVNIAEAVMRETDKWTPTPDAYEAACKALAHWRAEAKRLGQIAGETPREMNT